MSIHTQMSIHRMKCTMFIQQLEYISKNESSLKKFWVVIKYSILYLDCDGFMYMHHIEYWKNIKYVFVTIYQIM